MAVTNMWAVKGSVSSVVKYIENPEKTTQRDMQQVMSYITDADKTEQMMYVTGINCEPEIAAKQFTQTKQLWGKEGGRVAYHGYQSFREGEVDADTAHKIGVELAQRLWGDRFEVVVATHLNTGHFHNHFCLNSVSFRDGYKYRDTKEDIRRMRDTSDAICRRYGLSIEDRPRIDQDKRRNYRELKDEREFRTTLRNKVRADIDAAISCSLTLKEFGKVMRDMGYKFILEGETGKELKYPKLVIPGSDICVRLKSLGPGYDVDDYHERIIRNSWESARQNDPFVNLEDLKTQAILNRYNSRLNRAGFRVVITYHCLQLRSCKYKRKYREYSPQLIKDIRKLERLGQLQSFSRKYRLDTPQQVENLKEALRKRISDIAKDRDEDRKQQRLYERKGMTGYANYYRLSAQEKTKQMRRLYQELRMCEEILQAEPGIRAMTLGLVRQRVDEESRRQYRSDLGKTQRKRSGWSR